jgi:hypothetical protein
MRNVTLNLPVYEYKELDPKVQERIREGEREFLSEVAARDYFPERYGEILADAFAPLAPKDIRWSLGYCQGDGFSCLFESATYDELLELVKRKMPDSVKNLEQVGPYKDDLTFVSYANSYRSHYHYSHEATVYFEFDFYADVPTNIELALKSFVSEFTGYYRDVCKQCAKAGYDLLYPDDDEVDTIITEEGAEYFADGRVFSE